MLPRGGRGYEGDLKLSRNGQVTEQSVRIRVYFNPGATRTEYRLAVVGLCLLLLCVMCLCEQH